MHAGDALDGLLHLLGEDLLAARVDDLAAAAEQDERAVRGDLGHVAGERVAHAVDDPERARRLLGVLEVAERHVAAGGDHADLADARLHLAVVLGEHLRGRVAAELGGAAAAGPSSMMLLPIDPSDEPIASSSTTCSMRSSSASFTSAVHITPDEMIIFSDDVSYGRAGGRGLVDGRDDRLRERVADDRDVGDAARCCTVEQISSASSDRLCRVTTWPPASCGMNAPSHTPVPCISGAHGMLTMRLPASMAPLHERGDLGRVLGRR